MKFCCVVGGDSDDVRHPPTHRAHPITDQSPPGFSRRLLLQNALAQAAVAGGVVGMTEVAGGSCVGPGGLHDQPFVRKWVAGFDELRKHVVDTHPYTPEWTATVTGVPADTIRHVARQYATAKPAAIFCNAGISHQLGAFDTYRVIAFLAAVTGNVAVPGGGCNFSTTPGRAG